MARRIWIARWLLIAGILVITCYAHAKVYKVPYRTPSSDDDRYCYAKDDNPYAYFGTKTTYKFIHGNLDKVEIPAACQPIRFWSVIRHGTRYSGRSRFKEFSKLGNVLAKVIQNYRSGRSTLCIEDYMLLKSWKWDFSINETLATQLAPQGFDDLKQIAKRFKKKYPSLFDKAYSNKDFYFQYTVSDRTRDSFKAYSSGLFSNTSKVAATESNDIIKEYKTCSTWNYIVDQKGDNEYTKFLKTEEYQKVVEKVSRRLGFDKNIHPQLLKTIFMNCAYEKAWHINEKSRWCAAFDKEDLQVMEYGEDLIEYYESGYGIAEYNIQLGCPMVKDLYRKMEEAVNGISTNKAEVIAMFTHSVAIQQMLVSLGLFKDRVSLTGDNYTYQKDRKWRSSLFCHFASNIAAVIYKCKGENPFKVQLYLNERPLEVSENCPKGLCSWKTFKQLYQERTQSCNMDICARNF